jgi:hypothetical protein
MKTRTTALFLLLASFASAGGTPDKVPTERIKGFCDIWIDTQDNPPKLAELTPEAVQALCEKLRKADRCQAFINGVSNEMMGTPAWLDEAHKRIGVGNWEEGVTTKQEILVFVDYVNQHPASLNKPANQTLRLSAEDAGIYTYATP